MIDQLTTVTKMDDSQVNTLQKVLASIHEQAWGMVYSSSTEVSISMVPVGKSLMVDDGGSQRLYFRTGENKLVFLEFPI